MKKILYLTVLIMIFAAAINAEVLSVDPEATAKPIKITVEGLPDSKPTSLTTVKDVFFKNELFRPNTANSVAVIKKMAESNVTESEIIDAIITKLADVETELRKQQVINMFLLILIGVLVVMTFLFILWNRKK